MNFTMVVEDWYDMVCFDGESKTMITIRIVDSTGSIPKATTL